MHRILYKYIWFKYDAIHRLKWYTSVGHLKHRQGTRQAATGSRPTGQVAYGCYRLQPPPYVPVFLPDWRGSQAFNQVDHQTADQGRGEGCLPWPPVASARSLSLPLGPSLQSVFWMSGEVINSLTGSPRVRYAQNRPFRRSGGSQRWETDQLRHDRRLGAGFKLLERWEMDG